MLLTPSQDAILYDINPTQKAQIQAILTRCGIQGETEIDPLVRYSMACPALPTCGLATAESERAIPSILDRIRTLLTNIGLEQESFIIRMTGCPNGCARPYLAELAFVGNGPDTYQIWLGAAPNQTRLAQVYLEKLHINDLETALEPIFVYFKQSRQPGESFGDFCDRVGLVAIHQYVSQYQPESSAAISELPLVAQSAIDPSATDRPTLKPASKTRRRVALEEDLYTRLQETALREGKPVSHLANAAIAAYLSSLE